MSAQDAVASACTPPSHLFQPRAEIRHRRALALSVLQSVPIRADSLYSLTSHPLPSKHPWPTGRSPSPTTELHSTDGRSSLTSPPCRALSPTPSITSPESHVLPQGSGRTDAGVHALGPGRLLLSRSTHPGSQSPPRPQPSPPAQHPHPLGRAGRPKTSTPATAPCARPTSTASPPPLSAPPCSPPTYGTAPGPSTFPHFKTPPTTS